MDGVCSASSFSFLPVSQALNKNKIHCSCYTTPRAWGPAFTAMAPLPAGHLQIGGRKLVAGAVISLANPHKLCKHSWEMRCW
jgi:hypothetical protein